MFLRDDYFILRFKFSYSPFSGKHPQFHILLRAGLSAITGSKRIISNRELNIVTIQFLFKWSPRYLTRLPCSLVRYWGHYEKSNSIFTSKHELFCLLDKHYSPLLTRKVDHAKKMRIWYSFIHLTKWRGGQVTRQQLIGDINQCSL